MYLRDTSFEFINNGMHHGFRELISPWLHVSASPSALTNDHVRGLHPVQIIDPFFNQVFHEDILYYTTAFIGRIRFTTTHYDRSKVNNDSSIIFKTDSEESFDRIRRIFMVNNTEPMFYVDAISNMTDFEFSSATNTY
jgi:hypothetical protein